jgi:hypothetical protein
MGSSFSMNGGGTSPEEQCVICLEKGPKEGNVEEQVQICPNGHYAHLDCISLWYAKADKCPECRVVVRDFPLWREINPELDWHSIDDPYIYRGRFERLNYYEEALAFFRSPQGRAYVEWVLDGDIREYIEALNNANGIVENVDIGRINPLIKGILDIPNFEVAQALHDVYREINQEYRLREATGTIINSYYFDDELNIARWLYEHGYSVSIKYLYNAAIGEEPEQESVRWFLNRRPINRWSLDRHHSINENGILDIYINVVTNEETRAIFREYFGSKNLKIIEMTHDAHDTDVLQNLKTMLLDYTKRRVKDVDYDYILEILKKDEYIAVDMTDMIQDMIYIHSIYDNLIQDGTENGIEDFIKTSQLQGYEHYENKYNYSYALDIDPYLNYVKSDEYDHSDKVYVIEKMNELREILDFTGMQQGGMAGQAGQAGQGGQGGQAGQAGQYGGMWQRGGFFMTCS